MGYTASNSRFIASLMLILVWADMVKNAIVTKPDDALVIAGSRVMFNCSTDLENPMNWWHTPVGSDESIEFYFLEGIAQTIEFYQSGFHVDTTIAGHHNLIIDNVTARHAGRYDCYDKEGVGKIRASAELNVIEKSPDCGYVNSIDSSATEITCNISMTGNLEPKLECQDGWHNKSSTSVFGSYDNDPWRIPGKNYLSTNASLPQNTEKTHFTCSIRLNEYSPPLISIHVQVEHGKIRGGNGDQVVLLILVITSTVISLILIILCWILLHKRYRDRQLNQCESNTEFDNKDLIPDVKVIPDVNEPKNVTTTPIVEDELTVHLGKQNDDHEENSQNCILRHSNEVRNHNLSPGSRQRASEDSSSSADSTIPLIIFKL